MTHRLGRAYSINLAPSLYFTNFPGEIREKVESYQ